MIADKEEFKNRKSTVVYQENWHKGIVGIVASRIIEHHYKPTIVLTLSNGKITGSARSIKGFNMFEGLNQCADYLENYGGHYFAAGLTLYPEKLEDFKKAFEMQVQAVLTKDQLKPRVVIDAAIELPQIKGNLLRQIQRMGPFGPQNMNPLFMAYGVRNTGLSRLLENKNGGQGHIKFSITIDGFEFEGQPLALDGIGFSMGEFWPIVDSGMPFDIAFHIEENDFKGKKTLQLVIKEIRKHELL
jgi:single-stranded-DNA-specific exonuclease